jgi:signal peptidase II
LRRHRRPAVIAVIAVAVLICDQLTKTFAVDHFATHSVHIIGPLSFELAYNTGAAFSIGTGAGLPIVVVAVVLLFLIIWLGRRSSSLAVAIATGMILGGACGNIFDRIFRNDGGAVVDFIHTGVWPTFNLADASVVCGCVVLFARLWRTDRSSDRGSAVGTQRDGEGSE